MVALRCKLIAKSFSCIWRSWFTSPECGGAGRLPPQNCMVSKFFREASSKSYDQRRHASVHYHALSNPVRVVLYQSAQLVRAAPQDRYTSFHVPAALSSYHIRFGDLLGDRRLPPAPGSRSQGKHICREAAVDCVQSCMPTGLLTLFAVPYSMYELYQQCVLHCAESLVINHCGRSFLE